MGRSKHCTQEQRFLIKKLLNEGKTYKFIEETLGCSSKMILNAKKWAETPENRGRKRKISPKNVKKIMRLVKTNPFITTTKIKQELNLQVNPSTIRRRLIEAKLPSRSPRKTPLLKKRHVHDRLQFAREKVDWPSNKWRNILWTDESKIVLFGRGGCRKYVRRPVNTEYNPRYTMKTVKHGGLKINVWGCFSYNGTGPIYRIKDNMTAVSYCNILEKVMLPYAEWHMPLKWIFQQDNDPKHCSKLAKAWFNSNKIQVMDWPAQSPDLNPIENLWGDVKEEIYKAVPKHSEELWTVVKNSWYKIPKERCQKLVDSMPRRCAAVIANKGYSTKY